MLVECPVLTKHFATPNIPHFSVFRVKVEKVDFLQIDACKKINIL
ncbi:hypothetical protein SC08_Contig95orf00179 [Clostridium butyricum]|nr:hypothetical protein SC08_Contig95orf00179 [Clostridium butyricum]